MSSKDVNFRRRTLGLTYFEGSLFAIMVAATEYFALYFAIRKGVSPTQVALLTTVPLFIGAIANFIVPSFVSRRALKPAILFWVAIQIVGIAFLVAAVVLPSHFAWTFAGLTLYWLGGMSAGPLWMDWIAGWLPLERFGRFFSRRASFLAFVSLGAYLLTAWVIDREVSLEVFLWIFLTGLIFRFFSFFVLIFQRSPSRISRRMAEVRRERPTQWTLGNLWIVMLFAALFKFAANLASPFFLPYEVEQLGFNAFEVAYVNASSFLGMALLMSSFGEAMKSFQPITGLQVSMLMAALNCGLWYFVEGPIFATVLQFFSGLTWAVFDLACVLMIQANFPSNSRKWIGIQVSLASIGVVLGSLVGSALLTHGFQFIDNIVISSASRFGVLFMFAVAVHLSTSLRHPLHVYRSFIRTAFVMRISFSDMARVIAFRDRRKSRKKPKIWTG